MNVAESSVRFPITVIVRVVLVIVFGYVSLTFLSVELKPGNRAAGASGEHKVFGRGAGRDGS